MIFGHQQASAQPDFLLAILPPGFDQPFWLLLAVLC